MQPLDSLGEKKFLLPTYAGPGILPREVLRPDFYFQEVILIHLLLPFKTRACLHLQRMDPVLYLGSSQLALLNLLNVAAFSVLTSELDNLKARKLSGSDNLHCLMYSALQRFRALISYSSFHLCNKFFFYLYVLGASEVNTQSCR